MSTIGARRDASRCWSSWCSRSVPSAAAGRRGSRTTMSLPSSIVPRHMACSVPDESRYCSRRLAHCGHSVASNARTTASLVSASSSWIWRTTARLSFTTRPADYERAVGGRRLAGPTCEHRSVGRTSFLATERSPGDFGSASRMPACRHRGPRPWVLGRRAVAVGRSDADPLRSRDRLSASRTGLCRTRRKRRGQYSDGTGSWSI